MPRIDRLEDLQNFMLVIQSRLNNRFFKSAKLAINAYLTDNPRTLINLR